MMHSTLYIVVQLAILAIWLGYIVLQQYFILYNIQYINLDSFMEIHL